jgi:hypothetical protein
VLVSQRRVVERSFAWLTRFRRLAGDFEWLPDAGGLHCLAFVCLMLTRAVKVLASS